MKLFFLIFFSNLLLTIITFASDSMNNLGSFPKGGDTNNLKICLSFDTAKVTIDSIIVFECTALKIKEGNTYSIGSLGENLIVNGSFSDFSSWDVNESHYNGQTSPGNWQLVPSGINNIQPHLGELNRIGQNINLDNGELYRIEWTVSNYISGGVTFFVGGMPSLTAKSNGTIFDYIKAGDENTLVIQAVFPMNLTVGNIKLQKVTKSNISIEGDLIANGDIVTNGLINTGSNKKVLIGNWDTGIKFNSDFWHPTEDQQPSVAIGYNSMSNGIGVAIGPNAGKENSTNGYITAVGINSLKNNISGHATAYGTGSLQNSTTSNSSCFGDEACASTTSRIQTGFGYYALNAANDAGMTGVGYEAFRLATTGENTGVGNQIGRNTTTGRITGVGVEVGYHNTTGTMIGIGVGAGGRELSNFSLSNIEDNDMIYIGDNTLKSTSTTMQNSIIIGHNQNIDKSFQTKIGYAGLTQETQLFGALGIDLSINSFPVEKLHLKGDFIRIDQEGLNGTSINPTSYGIKMFSNNGTNELSRIEVLNRNIDTAYGELQIQVANNTGYLNNIIEFKGSDKTITIPGYSSANSVQVNAVASLVVDSTGKIGTMSLGADQNFFSGLITFTGATSLDANTAAANANIAVGHPYKWDDGNAIHLMFRK